MNEQYLEAELVCLRQTVDYLEKRIRVLEEEVIRLTDDNK
jgi:uncharacterized small protein (DUF1192 family)